MPTIWRAAFPALNSACSRASATSRRCKGRRSSTARCSLSSAVSRNDATPTQLGEEPEEHLLAVDIVTETQAARLAAVGEEVIVPGKDEIGEGPGRDILVGRRRETVFFDHAVPQRFLVGHHEAELQWHGLGDFHVEEAGDPRPHVVPAEEIAIVDVESLVGGA